MVSAGTLLTAFGLGGADAFAAGLYYLAHTTFAAAALFLLADVISVRAARCMIAWLPARLPRGQLLAGVFLLVALALVACPHYPDLLASG